MSVPLDIAAPPSRGAGPSGDASDRGAWRRRVPAPTVRLAWALAASAVVTLLVPELGFLAACAALLAGAIDAIRSPDPRRVTVTRDLPAIVPLGGQVDLVWTLVNPSPRRTWIAIADELAPSLGYQRRRATVRCGPRERRRVTTSLTPTRRGRFHPTHVTVRVSGPWRLATRQHTRALPGQLEVHPSFRSRREAELRLTRTRLEEVGLRSARGRGSGTEFDALREYVPGDDVRRVDWAATARTGRTTLRTYRAERNQSVLALLDTGRVMAGTVEGVPRLDHAMDAVLALTTATGRMGDRLGLLAFGADVRSLVAPRRDGDQLRRVSSAMFDLEPELAESDYRAAFARTLVAFRRRSLLVLFTELADEAISETLVPALPLVLREHVLVVVSVRDPLPEALVEAEPDAAGDAYRAAAAAAAVTRRRQTARYLAGLGVTVVDEPPAHLAGRLVDVYLDLKARGRV